MSATAVLNLGAPDAPAKQIGQPITVGFSMCFHINRSAANSTVSQRNARQRNKKQIGLAIGNSGFPDVFSHQTQRRAWQCIARHSRARHRSAKHPGPGIRKSAFARSF